MKFYTTLHKYYCGIDLHPRILYVCILDQQGNKLVHQKIGADPLAFTSTTRTLYWRCCCWC
jgi:hypothetical protein